MSARPRSSEKWVNSQKRSRMDLLIFWKSRWRSALIRALEKLLIGNSISTLVVQDISSLSRMKTAMKKVRTIELLQNAQIVGRPSLGIQGRFPEFGDTRRAIFRYEIEDAVIHLETGLANLCGGFLVEEFFGHYSGIFGGGTVAHEYFQTTRKARHVEGSWVVVALPRYYYHFVAQTLPTAIRSLQHPEAQGILASNKMPNWAREALAALNTDVIYLEDETLEIANYICSSVPQVTSRNDVEILRNGFSPYLLNEGSQLAFIGRGNRHRNLGGLEEEVAEFVQTLGGSEVDPEAMGWKQELEFFSSCDRIIFIGGSAMANIVWMRPGTKVLVLTVFDGFTTQIENSLIDAANVQYAEIDTTDMTTLTDELKDKILQFAKG